MSVPLNIKDVAARLFRAGAIKFRAPDNYAPPEPPRLKGAKRAGRRFCRWCGRNYIVNHTCTARKAVAVAVAVAAMLCLNATAQSTNIPITRTNQPIAFIQPEGKSVIVSQRVGEIWKIWFAQGPLKLGTNHASQACCVLVTNPAVKVVRVTIQ